ncbi:MAG: acyl-CoA carboxylase epsilon subunit [Acidimicrobiia bacterium]
MSEPTLRVVSPDATPDEVAAITAALTLVLEERSRERRSREAEMQSMWVRAPRTSGRGAGMTRGPWRLSGRIDRRSRA